MKAISAQFMERKDGFDVVVDGRAVIVHRVDAPAFTLARGNPDVAMYRGNFRIDDSPKGMIAPTQIASISTEAVCLSHNGNPILRLTIIPEYDGFTLCIASQQAEFDRLSITLPATAEERIWGGGEQMSYLNLRGRKFPMWTSEPGVGRDKSTALTQLMDEEGMAGGDYWTTNYPQPTFLSSQNYACHLTSTAYSELDFTDPGHHRISVWENTAELRFFFGEDLLSLVRQVSDYFGRPPPLPDWAIGGAIVGLKDGANSFDRLNHIRAAGASVSALWCEDWVGVRQTSFGRRLFWDWQWNMERYPNLSQHIAQLADDGIRFMGYVNPYLAVDGPQFAEAQRLGHLALQIDGDTPYAVDFGEFDAGVVDFTSGSACEWFAEEIIGKHMLDFGLSGWMADFGEYLPTDLRLHDGSDPMRAHNRWPVLWAKVNADAIAARGKTGDALFFMRAGFSGSQRHCALLWAGDQSVDFSRHDGIGTVITAALSAGLVGNPYSHHDVGGYTSLHGNVRTNDLMMRWIELGAFTPVMRSHEGNRPDDNLQIDSTPEILAHFAAMSRVHAALAPYVRSLCDVAVATGLPLQRPLFLHFPDDPHCHEIFDQYLYGEDMLIAPIVTENAHDRMVYLPETNGDWVHLWSGNSFASGHHRIAAPYGAPPVFTRSQSAHAALFARIAETRHGAVQ